MKHELKTIEPYFDDVEKGLKTFEIRFNDRNYLVGDTLILKEYDKVKKKYTGRVVAVDVVYVLDDPIFVLPGYIVMSIHFSGTQSTENEPDAE